MVQKIFCDGAPTDVDIQTLLPKGDFILEFGPHVPSNRLLHAPRWVPDLPDCYISFNKSEDIVSAFSLQFDKGTSQKFTRLVYFGPAGTQPVELVRAFGDGYKELHKQIQSARFQLLYAAVTRLQTRVQKLSLPPPVPEETITVRFFAPRAGSSPRQKRIADKLFGCLQQVVRRLSAVSNKFRLDPAAHPIEGALAFQMGLGFDGPAITAGEVRVRPSGDTWADVERFEAGVAAGLYNLLRWPGQHQTSGRAHELLCHTRTPPEAFERACAHDALRERTEEALPCLRESPPALMVLLEPLHHLPRGQILTPRRGNKHFIPVRVRGNGATNVKYVVARKGKGSQWHGICKEKALQRCLLHKEIIAAGQAKRIKRMLSAVDALFRAHNFVDKHEQCEH